VRKNARRYEVFLRVVQSRGFRILNQNSNLVRKVSRVFIGNGRFAESKSGDWFDLPLGGEACSHHAISARPKLAKFVYFLVSCRGRRRFHDLRRGRITSVTLDFIGRS
jgi:hypothetical protein